MARRRRPSILVSSYGWLRRRELDPSPNLHVYESPDGFLVHVPSSTPERDIVFMARLAIDYVKEHGNVSLYQGKYPKIQLDDFQDEDE